MFVRTFMRISATWPGATSSEYSDRISVFRDFKTAPVDVGTFEIVCDRMLPAFFGACPPDGDVLLITFFRRRLDTTVKSLSEAISSSEEPSEVSMRTTLGPNRLLAPVVHVQLAGWGCGPPF
ncbi:hypothetical protein HPB52_024366 [Rhipicephalus sanguineus]|uniref:Uncharacterized protein n=1 Tax=Rhipicephalus sanguineus TaxID=34632 RepID=A0A9D4TCC5_RHISA|nr:hypothetical protein HPB52_024366 [Rhipicephalus sanguineus]